MPLMPISVAAALANMHPQTVRQYDRLGLVIPGRTKGKGRRYSLKNVERLLNIQRMSRQGVNLEGIRRIIELEEEKDYLLSKIAKLEMQVQSSNRVFTADSKGRIHPMRRGMRYSIKEEAGDSCALVIWKPAQSF
ncbi:MerR family transcriptional regulator [Actinomyces sp. zg-332]|nr:MerR family transcriptional regulator [Actinomyces sp. zg-332]